jgi:hypothetical protein
LLFGLGFHWFSLSQIMILGIPHLKSPTRNPMPQLR